MIGSELEERLRSLRDALPGQTLAGSNGRRYPLGQRIGEGGQGWIFRATWNGSVDVVVKVLRPDAATPDSLARFEREANVLRTMSQQPAPNPHVVRYYDHARATLAVPGNEDTWTFPFTVLEFVEGETLADSLARERGDGLGLERTRRFLRHIVLALRDVHAQNIIHRDLKPSNVLIDTSGAREIAKVTDFGLAKVFDDALHRTSALAGATVGYAPPEQFERGNNRVGQPTDVFSLAAIFFEMLTGEPCFPSADPLRVLHSLLEGNRPTFARNRDRLPAQLRPRPDVVTTLDTILTRALATAPAARYPTVTAFHDAVEDAFATVATSLTLRHSERPADLVPRAEQPTQAAPPSAGDLATTTLDATRDRSLRAPSVAVTRDIASAVGAPATDVPPPVPSAPGVAPSPSSPPLVWSAAAPPVWRRPLHAIAVAPDGRGAAGIGSDGLCYWNGRGWGRIELPRFVAPANVRTLAWFGGHLVVAGASSTVYLGASDGTYTPFEIGVPGLVVHGAYADAIGIVLAGEQLTHAGGVGFLGTMTLQQGAHGGGVLAIAWVVAQGVAPLRAVLRLASGIVACGDRGTLATVRDGRLAAINVCEPALVALAPTVDGAAVAVGGGGFVFRVNTSLDAQLEAVQTTRALSAVTRGLDGTLYAGGEGRRVLRRTPVGWVRDGATAGAGATAIRALSAGNGGVTALCDDGSVLEGAKPLPGAVAPLAHAAYPPSRG